NYRYGAICSDDCYNILIEGNLVEHNSNAGIFFSRNMTDSIARDNHIVNARTGVLLSESSNNQIYNNTIEGATGEGIGLLNPDLTDDGVTEGNLVYNNRISNSGTGVSATRSQNNIVENTTFSGIESGEFRIFGEGSALTIKGQYFDNTLISVGGSETGVSVEIVDSGTIQVTEGAGDEEEGDEGNGDGESETQTYNTNNEPFRRTLSDGDSITVTSTASAEG
ncbi:MAG: right-handed parallel beta-helix repeat-containing protein, partial [Thermoproteota archaeon]|nr:right-handed parallel beta-helix repeat-containing protein [Thermoproteota archaeon]